MTYFLIAGALLLAASLAALLFPLLRKSVPAPAADSSALSLQVLREQLAELENEQRAGTLDPAQYDKERSEIERRAIEDGRSPVHAGGSAQRPVWLAVTISLCVLALSIGTYLKIGNLDALDQAATQGAQQQNAHAVTPQQIEAMVGKLAERLQSNPDDGDGWLMLARSYSALGRYPQATAAFAKALEIFPNDAQLLADYADLLAMAQGRRLQGPPEKVIKRALSVDPRNIKALALSGSVAFERQNYAAAITEWRKALAIVPTDSDIAARFRDSIADAQSRAGQTVATTTASDAKGSTAKTISGVVALDASLRGRAADGDTVFIFARAANGPRMPIAIKRLTVKDLPARFTLDDSMGMAGGAKLSAQAQVVVGARISKSGSATPGPGDLEGYAEGVAIGSTNVRITIATPVK